jgi:hypothetical protein
MCYFATVEQSMTTERVSKVSSAEFPVMQGSAVLTGYASLAVAGLLPAAAVFIVWRRLAGALETPLWPAEFLATAGLLAVLAWFAHTSARNRRQFAARAFVSTAIIAVSVSLSVPGVNLAALFGFWAVILGEEFWAWRDLLPSRRADAFQRPIAAAEDFGPVAKCQEILDQEPAEPEADVLQQLTLRTTADGGQELSGWLRMPLAAGQRTGNLHVAFCPPLAHSPKVQAEVVSGPECRFKTAQVFPYGARFDFRLIEPAAEDESLLVWLFAEAGPS